MKIVGITGGIGSGKSTIASIFSSLGIPVYHADDKAKALYSKPNVKSAVIALFGEEVYSGNSLNRAFLAEIVFKDSNKLQALNSIIHPAVKNDFEKWVSEQDAAYVLKEAAILIESGSYKDCDSIILVSAPQEIRLDRVLQRDNATKEEVNARMKKQWTDDQKRPYAQYEIDNSGQKSVIKQVLDIHHELLKT